MGMGCSLSVTVSATLCRCCLNASSTGRMPAAGRRTVSPVQSVHWSMSARRVLDGFLEIARLLASEPTEMVQFCEIFFCLVEQSQFDEQLSLILQRALVRGIQRQRPVVIIHTLRR